MDNNRKIVSWSYYNGDSIFKGASKREEVNYVMCSSSDNCVAFKLGKCGAKGLMSGWCPYGRTYCEQGFTRHASKYGEIKRKYEKLYPDSHLFLGILDFLCPMGERHINIGLPWVEKLVSKVCEDNGYERGKDFQIFASQSVMPIELFTKNFIINLLEYTPRSLFGDSLREEYEKKLPWWCLRLKRSFPELYVEVLTDYPKLDEYVRSVNFIGKKAYIKTLLQGELKVNGSKCFWDGTVLTSTGTQFGNSIFKEDLDTGCLVTIQVTDTSTCEILDNNTVTENTKFIE